MTEKTRDIQSLLDDLGQAVKAARVDRGLTQADVVKACGLSQNIVTNLEKGKGTAVASLLAILEHLDLADDIIKAILPKEVPTKRDVRYRAPAEKEPESSDSLKLEPLELYRDEDEIITMTRTLKRDELNQALSEDPMGVYRISHAVVGELMRDLQANIAVHIRTCKFRLAGGGVRQKEAYFATSITKAKTLDLVWSVGGNVMKKSAVVQAFVSKEYVKGLTADKAQSEREILLAGLRTKFGEHDIFVESVTWTNDRTELHKGNREVRGAKYRKLFDTVVQVWVNNL